MNLRDLLDEALGDVPQAAAGRCVHERASVATCHRCVTSCPRDAWQLDDEQLMIDIGQCDGCGVCVANCPEGALSQVGVSPEPYAGAPELSLSCERAESDAVGDWRLPCIHAVGLAWLVSMYRAGLRQIELDIGNCQTCDRRDDEGLPHSVERLNTVLAQRKLPQIALGARPTRPAASGPDDLISRQDGPALSRRGFLRRMLSAPPISDFDESEATTKSLGDCLPPAREGDLALFVPEIDVHRCNGCDACVRVCCHDALICEQGPSDAYRIAADACTGCGLCVDICDRDAISVSQDAVVSQTKIPLAVGNCKVCGVRFHGPERGCDSDSLCQVCSRVDHKRNLYQVL